MFVPNFVVSGLHGCCSLCELTSWQPWLDGRRDPYLSPSLVADGIASTPKIPCSYGVVMKSSQQTSQPYRKGEAGLLAEIPQFAVLRTFLLCWELSCRPDSFGSFGIEKRPEWVFDAQSSLIINIEGLSWQIPEWPTRNKWQPVV